jgi:hypothetical protein
MKLYQEKNLDVKDRALFQAETESDFCNYKNKMKQSSCCNCIEEKQLTE